MIHHMASPKVGIIGAGISGTVLAIFLKSKGYDPVIFERYESPTEVGLGIAYVYLLYARYPVGRCS